MNLIETGDQQINADGDPNLSSNGVLGGTIEGFDTQVLLNPLEEKFDLPTPFIDGSNCQCRQIEVIGQEDQSLSCIGIEKADTSQLTGVVSFTLFSAQSNNLIAAQTGRLIDWSGLTNVESGVAFCPNDKVGVGTFYYKESSKVEVSPVEDIDTSGLNMHLIHEVDIMHRTVCDLYEDWDRTGQVNLGVEFNRGFGLTEMSPGKHRKAQINSRSIHRINHLVDIQSVGIIGIQAAGFTNQYLSEGFIYAPVSILVRVGQIGSGDIAPDTHRVEVRTASQAGLDVSKTFSESDLSKSHRKKLIPGSHAPACSLHRVKLHAAIELLAVDEVGDLSENKVSRVHPLLRMKQTSAGQLSQMRHVSFSLLAA